MHNLSPQMRRQMREYLAASSHLAAQAAHSFVTQKFTPTLRGEVSWSCHRRWITSIWFLRDAERACLVGLATVLVPAVYSSGEMTHDDESLFVLQHGTAVLRGRILKPGKVWGDDLILSNPELRISCSHVCALSAYMEVQQLGRIPLLELLQRFPCRLPDERSCTRQEPTDTQRASDAHASCACLMRSRCAATRSNACASTPSGSRCAGHSSPRRNNASCERKLTPLCTMHRTIALLALTSAATCLGATATLITGAASCTTALPRVGRKVADSSSLLELLGAPPSSRCRPSASSCASSRACSACVLHLV